MFRGVLFFFLLVGGAASPSMAQDCDQSKTATAPLSRFSENNKGTLRDKVHGHIWLRCALGMSWNGTTCEGKSLTFSWRDAEEAIAEMNAMKISGRTDWRLPTIDELGSIVEHRCFKPAIDLQAFPYSPESGFWTATASPGVRPRAMVIHFLNGNPYVANKEQHWRVRPVAGK
jgi:hypothetical protein